MVNGTNDSKIGKRKCENRTKTLRESTTQILITRLTFTDSDGNGVIEFPEFLAMVNGTMPESLRPNQLERIFKVFDADNSNEINAENLQRMFKIFGQNFDAQTVAEMLQEVDLDGDGRVGVEDFTQMMRG